MLPKTHYADSGGVSIAYQMTGSGPIDVVLVPGYVSNLDLFWEEPSCVRWLERLGSFCRLIRFDKRGTGLSDRVIDMPSLEVRMDDVRAVMDAAGSERAALAGYSEGGAMSMLFAATYPERATALVMQGCFARWVWAPDYPWAPTHEQHEAAIASNQREWGGATGVDTSHPSMAHDARYREWWARRLRASASPAAVSAIWRMNTHIDVRQLLPAVRVPTLVLHSVGDRLIDVNCGRYIADRIPNARWVEFPGCDHVPWGEDCDAMCDEIEEFLTGERRAVESDRVLATVLFTDIVGATEHAARLGDRRWRDLIDAHHALVRRELQRFRGREIDTAGDGFLAAFDGPARAARCACAISEGVRALGVEVRAGLHTGECEVMGDKLGGIAVHIGARVAALAHSGEVLVSSTVKDLVAGSGLSFADRGVQPLKGVPGEWRLFAVEW